jgi:diphthamide biosynthesis protein 2
MTDAFSTPAEHAFDHPEIEAAVEAGPSSLGDALAGVPIEEAFEVDDTVSRILAGGFKTVSQRSSGFETSGCGFTRARR